MTKLQKALTLLITSMISFTYQGYSDDGINTKVTTWKGNKKAAFMLMFDDNLTSQVKNVIPELKKRGYKATFYINPGKHVYKKFKKEWEEAIPALGMVYGNHTFVHKSANNAEEADKAIMECNEVINRINPPTSGSKLISFAKPGVKVWNVSKEELAAILGKYNLILRPSFSKHGAGVHCKNAKQMGALVDKALKNGSSEYIIFHGVDGDYLKVSLDLFNKLLDKLDQHKDELWVATHADVHKYETERDNATVKIVENNESSIKIDLTSKVDKQLYDIPLTLQTKVPANWKSVEITQGDNKQVKKVNSGVVTYDAMPNTATIKLKVQQ